jgi:gliding motility-associated-like protein
LGCVGTDTFALEVKPAAVLTDVTPDFTIKYGDQMQLNASGVKYYIWFPTKPLDYPNNHNPTATGWDPTTFTVIGLNEYGCYDTAYVKMDIDYSMFEYMPTAFTPNGDGRNDLFGVHNFRYQRLIEFRIFNRWGQEVFTTNDYKQGWDGTFKGVPQESGVYNYIIRVAIPNGQQRTYKGDVTLIR